MLFFEKITVYFFSEELMRKFLYFLILIFSI